ncbi:MAG: LysR family transcriptional regulator [Burkholderiaceae bacterium]
MDDRLDARRARYFMQVLESGSVRGAAEILGMDPSAVSRAIGVLERECGSRLLERRGRGIRPTDAGELLATFLRRQHTQKQQLFSQLDRIQKVETGHVDLAAGEGFIDWLMGNSLREFMVAHPSITIDLSVGGTDEIVRRVIEERAHIGVLFQPPRDDRLRSHHSHPQPIVTYVLETHPLARHRPPLQLSDLQPYPGATLHRAFGVRQHIEAAEISEGVRLNPLLTTTSFHAVEEFVLAGLGYALSARLGLPESRGGVRVIELPMSNPLLSQGRVHVVSRHGRVLSAAAAALLRRVVDDIARLAIRQPA